MPLYHHFKRKKKIYKRKRFNRKRYHSRINRSLTTRMKGQGLSDSMFVKLTYCDDVAITGGVLAYMSYIYRGNSLYDPDLTGVGHQPLYFDQYINLYARYRVLGSKIQIDVINSNGGSALFYVVEPNTDISSITDIATLYEQARSGAPKIVPIAQRVASRMKKYASTRKIMGLVKSQVFDDDFAGTSGSNPIQLWYWNLLFASTDQTTVPSGRFIIKITYFCQFYDRVFQTQS